MGPMEAYRSSIQRRRRSVVCMLKPLLLGVGCVVPYRRWRDPRRVIVQEVPGWSLRRATALFQLGIPTYIFHQLSLRQI